MNIAIPNNLNSIFINAMMFMQGDSIPKQNGEGYIEVCKKSFSSIGEIYDYLDVPDSLTDYAYGEPGDDGKYTFPSPDPYDDRVKAAKPCTGLIGEQNSSWHTETLKEYAAMVTYNLVAADVKPEMAAMLGVLHCCGMKYAAETIIEGSISFPGYEYLSTYLTVCWIYDWGLAEEEKREIIATVYGHTKYYDWLKKTGGRNSEKNFIKEVTKVFGEDIALKAHELIKLLGASEEGVKRGEKKNTEKIKKGEEIIKQ